MEERWREPAALAEQYAGMLYRLAYARTGSRADAEDVMQEVFVRLLRARPAKMPANTPFSNDPMTRK